MLKLRWPCFRLWEKSGQTSSFNGFNKETLIILANMSKIFQHNIKELSSYFIFFLYTKSLYFSLMDECFPGGSEVNASAWNAGDLGAIPGSGRCPGEGNGNPLQCSCLENPRDGGAWWAAICGVAQSQTQLKWFSSSSSSNSLWSSERKRLIPAGNSEVRQSSKN